MEISVVRHCVVLAMSVTLAFASHASLAQVPAKDQSKLPMTGEPEAGPGEPPPVTREELPPPAAQNGEDLRSSETPEQDSDQLESMPDEMSLGEIPVITTIELTEDIAKRAIDAFAAVRDKYQDANLEEFENLQDFVDQVPEGKQFEADIKSFGFENVTEWNTAITTVGFAYSALTDDQTHEILLQIDEISKDDNVAQDMKDRMVSSLRAMIPSENNKKVIENLARDPAYEEKLKLLAEEE